MTGFVSLTGYCTMTGMDDDNGPEPVATAAAGPLMAAELPAMDEQVLRSRLGLHRARKELLQKALLMGLEGAQPLSLGSDQIC